MKAERIGDVTVARLGPKYDAYNKERLEEAQRALFGLVDQADPPILLLDFADTEYFSSTFIEILFRVWNRLKQRKGKLGLCRLNEVCRDMVHTARLDMLWPIFDTINEAVVGLSGSAD